MNNPSLGRTLRVYLGLAALLLCLGSAGTVAARTLQVGPGEPFQLPSAAAAQAQDGDLIQIAPGRYVDCAVWKANNLVITGMGRPPDTIIADKSCGGKGLFLTDGVDITVRNLTLTGARVPDKNGVGIRMEANNLTVEGVRFIDNENGILVNTDVRGWLMVRDSEFVFNGIDSPWGHGLYAGPIDLVRIERSRFYQTRQGHHIKSRALRTEVIDSDLQDGPDGTSSYQIEAPNGGAVVVRGCTIEKGPKSENHTGAIVIGKEGLTHPTPEILVENNSFRVDGDYHSFLVVNEAVTGAVLKGNRLSGSARALLGNGEVR